MLGKVKFISRSIYQNSRIKNPKISTTGFVLDEKSPNFAAYFRRKNREGGKSIRNNFKNNNNMDKIFVCY
jgi:hypothetical protein